MRSFHFFNVKINSIVYLTEEAAEQIAKKNLELKLLQDDLVRRIEIFEKRGDLLVGVINTT